MKAVWKNWFYILRAYKSSVIFNLFSLSIAFVAFLLLILQVLYEWRYDSFHTDANCIYRLEVVSPDKGASALFSRPLYEEFVKSSPHIRKGALLQSYVAHQEFSFYRNDSRHFCFADCQNAEYNYLDLFRFKMKEGDITCMKLPDQVVIPESLSLKMFGSESALGKTIYAGESGYTIGGVYYDMPSNTSVKNHVYKSIPAKQDIGKWKNMNYQIFLLLDIPQNTSDILSNFKRSFHDENYEWNRGELRLSNIRDVYFETDMTFDNQTKGSKPVLYILCLIALLIIGVSWINYMNFSNSLIPLRIKNISLQRILGENIGRLRVYLFLEQLSLSVISYLAALLGISILSNTHVSKLLLPDISLSANLSFYGEMFIVPVFFALLSGMYSIYTLTSGTTALILKGAYSTSFNGRNLRKALIGFQFFVSFTLIVMAFFIYMQNKSMRSDSLGYDKDRVVIVEMNQLLNQKRDLLENELRNSSSVENVSFSNILFSSCDYYSGWSGKYEDSDISFQTLWVDENFIDVMGIQLKEGHNFKENETLQTNMSCIFNATAQKMYELEVGKNIDSTPNGDGTIVGIIDDVKFQSYRVETDPMAFCLQYKAFAPQFKYAYLKVSSPISSTLIDDIQQICLPINAGDAVDIFPFSDVVNRLYQSENNVSLIISLFSIVSILISLSGVYSLAVFDCQYRRKETAIRKVQGASTFSIILLFNTFYSRILLISFIVSIPCIYYAMEFWLQYFSYKTPISVWVFVFVFILMFCLISAIVTVLTWHTAKENPIHYLKME